MWISPQKQVHSQDQFNSEEQDQASVFVFCFLSSPGYKNLQLWLRPADLDGKKCGFPCSRRVTWGEGLLHPQGVLPHWSPRGPWLRPPWKAPSPSYGLAEILESHCSLAVEGSHPPRGKRVWTVIKVIIWASSSLWVDLKCCMSLYVLFLHMLPYTIKSCRVLLRGIEVRLPFS